MAIIVSDSRNPAYDGQLTTTNGWWRVEASNLGGRHTNTLSLSITRTINITFANSGNFRGFSVGLVAGGPLGGFKDTITAVLKESGVTRQTVVLTRAEIIGNTPTTTQFNSAFAPTFEFDYPVTTSAGVWTVEVSNSGAQTSNWSLVTSNGTVPFFVAWCDNQLTASSGNDCLVIKSPVNVNSSFITKCNGLPTGVTAYGPSLVLLTSDDRTVPNICNFRWQSPASSYTLQIDGIVLCSADSGWSIGTEANPIPFAQQAIVLFRTTPSFGTARQILDLRYSNVNSGASSFMFYGEVPANRRLTVASDATTGQPNVVLTSEPTGWTAGDRVWFIKNTSSNLQYVLHTISSVSGNTVTLTTNIATQITAGSPAINFERYGIVIRSESSSLITTEFQIPNNLVLKGVLADLFAIGAMRIQSGQGQIGITASTSKYLIEDSCHIRTSAGHFIGSAEVPGNGMRVNRCYYFGQPLAQQIFTYGGGVLGGPFQNSGIVEVLNCVCQGPSTGISGFGGVGSVFEGNFMATGSGNATASQGLLGLSGFINGTFKNNTFWRMNTVIVISSAFNAKEWSGNKFDHCAYCYDLFAYSSNCVAKNELYGQEGSVSNVVRFTAGSFTDFQIENSTGNVIVETNRQTNIVENNVGSLRIVDENGVQNADRVFNQYGNIVRTGDGLADTTKRGGQFAIRFQPITTTGVLKWSQDVPTGDIQGKTMTVGVWIKINSANYWSSTHEMPRITVAYDNGTEVYGEAGQINDWQFVFVPFTPTTASGQATITISAMTDQTGSDAYVYFDDFTAPLPQGEELNLGGFDLWSGGYPVVPSSFATSISASDVWSADPTNFGAGTVGEVQNKTLKNTKLIPPLL
jgi:hypothetical protein